MKIFAFGYRRRTGKDLAAQFMFNILQLRGEKGVVKIGFADYLKQVCIKLFPGSQIEDKDTIVPRYGVTSRDIFIKIGETLREIDPYIWIDKVFGVEAETLIITDVRKILEVDTLLESNGTLIRMDRDVPTTEIENDLDCFNDWNYIIDNNSTKQYIYKEMELIVNEHF